MKGFGPSGPIDWQVIPASPLTEYSKTNPELSGSSLLRSETPKPEMLKRGMLPSLLWPCTRPLPDQFLKNREIHLTREYDSDDPRWSC
jgi:hypothetical protein